MFNSQNLPHDTTYPAKPAIKSAKVMADRLTFQELQTLNLKLATQDYVKAMREMRNAGLQEIDSRWVELLA